MELKKGLVVFNGAEFGMIWKNCIDLSIHKNISIGSENFVKLFKQLWDREHEIREAIEIQSQIDADRFDDKVHEAPEEYENKKV